MNEKQCLKILKAIANESRLKILIMLNEPKQFFPAAKSDVAKEGVCLGQIAKVLDLSLSTTSSYMTKLESVGLVESKRCGQWTFYRLCPEVLNELSVFFNKLSKGENDEY